MQPFQPILRRVPDISLNEIITLGPDQQAVVGKQLEDLMFAVQGLNADVKSGEVSRQLASSILRAAEYYFTDVCKALEIETDTLADQNQRNAGIRSANQRVHLLEAELASKNTHDIGMGLKGLEDRFRLWWRTAGFGHVAELSFNSYGATATLSGMLFGSRWSSMSKTPVSDKAATGLWHEKLCQDGFVLIEDSDGSRGLCIQDCDASRAALQALLGSTLPSCELKSIHSDRTRGGALVLRDIDVLVRDLEEIAVLPAPSMELGS
jgi:hypothetical protein